MIKKVLQNNIVDVAQKYFSLLEFGRPSVLHRTRVCVVISPIYIKKYASNL